MSVHWVEAVAACWIESPERLLEEALTLHGFRIASRRSLISASAEPAQNGTLRWSRRQLPDGMPFLWVSDIDRGLGVEWWNTLSVLLDGFVVGYEKWDLRDLHRLTVSLSGRPLENRVYLPGAGILDARTQWQERCGLFFGIHPATLDETSVLEAEDLWLESIPPGCPPRASTGGRALLANIDESRFRELAAGGLAGWMWRPWSTAAATAIDLWNPSGSDPSRVVQWAQAANCLGVLWDIHGDDWRCLELFGSDPPRETVTRDPIALVRSLAAGTTAVGEPPAALGGRGLKGWRASLSV